MTDTLEPKILFNGMLIPAHEAWKKMETATVATEILERFNKKFPNLATEETYAVVPIVRKRLKEIELRLPKLPPKAPEIKGRAIALLTKTSPEDTLDTLRTEFGSEIDVQQLLAMTGKEPYLRSIAQEANELTTNKVSHEQMAELWNELKRPSPGGGFWTAAKVRRLIDGDWDD